jgi:predicted methyltransferase
MKTLLITGLLSFSVFADPISDAVNSEIRQDQRERDEYRHPAQTLRFMGIEKDMSVVEIWPGGGWYSNILAPLLADEGQYYAAHFPLSDSAPGFFKSSRENYEKKVATFAPYSKINVTSFDYEDTDVEIAPAGTADAVLTFRNVHNWYMRGDNKAVKNAFEVFFKALKSGGVLGVIEHRMPENFDDEEMKKTGYVKQSYVIEMAEKAGFKLAASSEVNANELDTANYSHGVWTLPPRYRSGKDEAKYTAIGESDRMTLKFVKP